MRGALGSEETAEESLSHGPAPGPSVFVRPQGELEVFGFWPWDEKGIAGQVAKPLEKKATHLRPKEIKENDARRPRTERDRAPACATGLSLAHRVEITVPAHAMHCSAARRTREVRGNPNLSLRPRRERAQERGFRRRCH